MRNSQDHPTLHDTPIGIDARGQRQETDFMGSIEVPAHRYWGAQTQRSLVHFSIGDDRMPKRVYHAYGYVKKRRRWSMRPRATAAVEGRCHRARRRRGERRRQVRQSLSLYVWQTGSRPPSRTRRSTEVLPPTALHPAGSAFGEIGSKAPVHPNDDVNLGQSSNDTFPTAMHIAAMLELEEHLLPRAEALAAAIEAKAKEWKDVVKTGRTHLQDAVPLTVGQEWPGYAQQLRDALGAHPRVRGGVRLELAAGGTAVGTGLNAPPGFSREIAARIAELTGHPFVTAPNKFAAQGSLDAMVAAMAALRGLAVALMKIANDMRWLASGRRCGLGELLLPIMSRARRSCRAGSTRPSARRW